MGSAFFDVVSKLSELSCHFILILMFVYSKVPSSVNNKFGSG